MRLIGELRINEFGKTYPQSARILERWVTVVRAAEWRSFVDVKKTFNTADYVAPYVVFDIGGDKFRLLSIIDFKESLLIVQSVLTHKEYDKWKP